MNVVWSEVTGLCGFWDGSCETGQALPKILGGTPIHTKSGRVRCRNSLDAELGGCGMLMENLCPGIDKSTREQSSMLWLCLSLSHNCIFSVECCSRGRNVTKPSSSILWYVGGLWLGCATLCDCVSSREEGQVIKKSNGRDQQARNRFWQSDFLRQRSATFLARGQWRENCTGRSGA